MNVKIKKYREVLIEKSKRIAIAVIVQHKSREIHTNSRVGATTFERVETRNTTEHFQTLDIWKTQSNFTMGHFFFGKHFFFGRDISLLFLVSSKKWRAVIYLKL